MVKEWYKKYVNWIVVCLLLLLGLKSCQSCQRSKQIQFYKQTSTIQIDSINNNYLYSIKVIDSLKNEIKLRDEKIMHLTKESTILKETNNYYKNTNKELVKTLNKDY